MNIEKIKYFIDLFEYRSFTETAKINFVSQTTISQQIASLEKEFEVQLIDRKQSPIKPTQAGYLFYSEAIVLWKQYNHMKEKIKHFTQNHTQVLNVAYAAMTDIQTLLKSMTTFKKKDLNIEVNLNKVLLKDVSKFLQKGGYDIAIAFDSEFKEKSDISTYPLYEGKYCVAVGHEHPLFHYKSISKNKLYEYPLVMINEEAIGDSYYLMIQHAIEDGFQPNILRTVDDVESEIFYIITENLIGFFPDNYQLAYSEEEVRLIPLEDSHHTFKIEIGYLKYNKNPALQVFLKHIQDSFFQ